MVSYLPVYNVHFFLTTEILPPKSRCALYTEPFVFMFGNLHNKTKSTKSNNSQFYVTSRNKSRKKVCLALCIISVHFRQYSAASVMQLVYDHDWKYVAFSRLFRWQGKFHEEFSFRLCRSALHSLIFCFFEQMRKDLKEKRSCKSFLQCHLESYHVAASLVPGLLVHKNVTGIVQMDRVRSCSSETAAEND